MKRISVTDEELERLHEALEMARGYYVTEPDEDRESVYQKVQRLRNPQPEGAPA